MPFDAQDEANRFRNSPTGPAVMPPRLSVSRPEAPKPSPVRRRRRSIWSVSIFVILMCSVAIGAYRDLSRPEAWAYWKESYLSPTMTASSLAKIDFDGSGHRRTVLAVSGTIGAASASWLREKLDDAHLADGDAVLLSSPGGNLDQALIMGEIIRSRGLATAVGIADASGRITRSFCASACVLVYAGGKPRFGIEGSALGVHRFVATRPVSDPIADAQRTTGMVLRYMTKMGISPSVVAAMSETRDVRWLGSKEASTMNLVTDPIGRP